MIATEEQIRTLKGIIYLIRNKINNKVYIGQTKRTFAKRYYPILWWKHPSINNYLKNSIKKHGPENFEIQFLESNIGTRRELNKLERKYIKEFESNNPDFGFNIKDAGYKNKTNLIHRKVVRERNGWTREGFIQKALALHGDKYNYDKMIYIDRNHKIDIRCNKCHTDLNIHPNNHLAKNKKGGCKLCQFEQLSKSHGDVQLFLDKAIEKHGNKFDYSKIKYKNRHFKIQIKCNSCGNEFYQAPECHLAINTCPICGPKTTSKKVIQIDPENEIVLKTFNSGVEASKEMGFNPTSVSTAILRGTLLGGYKWKYIK